jgi:hypothetical protein
MDNMVIGLTIGYLLVGRGPQRIYGFSDNVNST